MRRLEGRVSKLEDRRTKGEVVIFTTIYMGDLISACRLLISPTFSLDLSAGEHESLEEYRLRILGEIERQKGPHVRPARDAFSDLFTRIEADIENSEFARTY